jgi:serine/threonine protein kinase
MIISFSTDFQLGDTASYLPCIKKQHLSSIVMQLLTAVDFIHDKDILHRDIKPQNILISQGNQIKLSGFGVAARLPAVSCEMLSFLCNPLNSVQNNTKPNAFKGKGYYCLC